MLDPIQIRVLGVLVEKELTVPESYPLTDNSLLAGCNQKNNRDPEMSVDLEQLRAALEPLMRDGWVTRVEQPGNRTRKYRHHLESQVSVDDRERAVLVELLLRGPQAPGALKSRVRRLGFDGSPEQIEDVLHGLASRRPPLVECQPRRPRERDQRWTQLLGPQSAPASMPDPVHDGAPPDRPPSVTPGLEARVEALETELRRLRDEIQTLLERSAPTETGGERPEHGSIVD